jgi:hypothetical protein
LESFKTKSSTQTTTNNGIVKFTTQSAKGFKVVGWQIEESSSVGNYILTDEAVAIDVTTIQNPSNKGYDIFGNPLRLRQNAFNLDGVGYAEVADDASLTSVTNGTLQFWLKTSDTKFNILSGQSTSEFIGQTDNGVWSFGNAGTVTSYIGSGTASTQPLYDGSWNFYTFTGINISTWTTHEITNLVDFEYDGLLDEVLIYNRVLTSKEITNNYNIGFPTRNLFYSYSNRMALENYTLETNECVKSTINAL